MGCGGFESYLQVYIIVRYIYMDAAYSMHEYYSDRILHLSIMYI